jgi:hypothetical protein
LTLFFVQLLQAFSNQNLGFREVCQCIGTGAVGRDLTVRHVVIAGSFQRFVLVDLSALSVESPVLAVVDDHPVNPGRELGISAKAIEGAEERQEHVLRDFLGDVAVLHPSKAHREDAVLVPSHDLGISALISLFEPPDKLLVRRASDHR